MKRYQQDAHEKILYQAVVANDTISSATAAITPTGPTLGSVVLTSTTATVMVSALTAGTRYVLEVLATCGSGQILRAECAITGE
jgi:hypothetical protein